MSESEGLAPALFTNVVHFGSFRLLLEEQLLFDGDAQLHVGSRALAILSALVEKPGQTVSKEELFARAWGDAAIVEGNLKVQVAALRRVLGDGRSSNRFISSVSGRGYCFVAPTSARDPRKSSSFREGELKRTNNVPAPLRRMVGRNEIVTRIAAHLREHRFVTISGAGGIGKTTVALAVADALDFEYRDGIAFVDLGPMNNAALVSGAIATALGLALHTDNPVTGLTTLLRDKHMLLFMDSCEHVVEAAAIISESLFKNASGVHILATSREPLGAEGERVHRLAPLALPGASAGLTAGDALKYPAIELFAERAASRLESFVFGDVEAPFVADICRNLDGIALAIEIVAGRLDVFSVRELAAQMDGRFRLLTRGTRSALPRHQTLGAALDWSYEFLPKVEQVALRRLSIFAAGFAVGAAIKVVADEMIADWDVDEIVVNLIAKSLVSVEFGGHAPVYRLLEITRAYAHEKLLGSGEVGQIAARHAEYFRDLFEQAELEWYTSPSDAWVATYGRHLDGIRAALNWAYSPQGEKSVGVALTVAAIPLWMQLSLADECRQRAEEALICLRCQ